MKHTGSSDYTYLKLFMFLLLFSGLFCSQKIIKNTDNYGGDYYENISAENASMLRASLHKKISNHVRFTYREVWTILMDTDRDPEKKDNVMLIYSGKSIPAEHNNGVDSNNKDYWNREHVWPKSHGFKKKSTVPFTDVHHLKPADRTVNSSRGNKDFDFSDHPHREAKDTKIDSDSFEPAPAVRGDVARILFYMDVRYEGNNGEPDLILVDHVKTSGSELGKLCTLLIWHHEDPVSPFERRRNDRIYFYQKNRNPFIDHPEWADLLWKEKCSH